MNLLHRSTFGERSRFNTRDILNILVAFPVLMGENFGMYLPAMAASNFGSEQASGSEGGHLLGALMNMVKDIRSQMNQDRETNYHRHQQVMTQIGMIHYKVDTILQATVGKTTDGNWTDTNSMAALNEIRLQLKFLNEVRKEVFTGKEIKGEGDNPVRVAMVDESEQIIKSGPGSSAKVEITVHEAKTDENGNNQSHQYIKSDEAKPSFAKTYHVLLDEGIGDLTNAKLSQDSKWTKNCKCQLLARVLENSSDIKVQEAWSKPFVVSDSRSKLYEKYYPPSLSDEVWRLVNIGRGGKPWQRLKDNNILTVGDILFLSSVNPQRLHEIIRVGPVGDGALKAIMAHAETCVIDDTIIYLYKHSSEDNMTVVFNAIGKLMGVIHDTQCIQTSNLSEELKDRAKKLLCHAFEERSRLIPHSDGKAVMQLFQCEASTAFPNKCSIQDSIPGSLNATLDNTSRQERCEEINSANYDDLFCVDEILKLVSHLDEVNLAPNLHGKDISGAPLPDLVHTEGQIFTPESQPGGSMSMTNSYQEQMAGTSAEGSEAMLDSHQDSPNWNRPRKRSKNIWNG